MSGFSEDQWDKMAEAVERKGGPAKVEILVAKRAYLEKAIVVWKRRVDAIRRTKPKLTPFGFPPP
jgi:hypothetical protein